MNDSFIIPECYVDTNLIEALVPPQRGYNHQKGCPAVAKCMKEKFGDKFAVGITDKDKRELKYLEEFNLLANDESIYLYKHKEKPHYIIQVSPAVEDFILNAVAELGIELKEHQIPSDLESMKKETKKIDAKSSVKYRNLFKNLKKASTFKKLANIVRYLKEKQYRADDTELSGLISEAH